MITAAFGITKEPFNRSDLVLLPQQQEILNYIHVHTQHGGFSVVVGDPGVGKSILCEHICQMVERGDVVVVSISRTMHTYLNIVKQLAEAFRIDVPVKDMEKKLIEVAHTYIRERKTLYTLIDEAHLLDMTVLRKLRLLFDRFPKKHNLVLFGQRDLLYYLSMKFNEDIKSRITYSGQLLALNEEDLKRYIVSELEAVRLGVNVLDEAATELILRSAQGNLRLCRNLCYASLVQAAREGKKVVTISHVNNVLVQPHWRSHEDLIKQQAK
jgi:type II secretory pathway predicted ATPase ExeA